MVTWGRVYVVVRRSAVGLLHRYSTNVGVNIGSVGSILSHIRGGRLRRLLRTYGSHRSRLSGRLRRLLKRCRSRNGSPGFVTRTVTGIGARVGLRVRRGSGAITSLVASNYGVKIGSLGGCLGRCTTTSRGSGSVAGHLVGLRTRLTMSLERFLWEWGRNYAAGMRPYFAMGDVRVLGSGFLFSEILSFLLSWLSGQPFTFSGTFNEKGLGREVYNSWGCVPRGLTLLWDLGSDLSTGTWLWNWTCYQFWGNFNGTSPMWLRINFSWTVGCALNRDFRCDGRHSDNLATHELFYGTIRDFSQ